MTGILRVNGLGVTFRAGDKSVQAVRDLTFSVRPGTTLGIVGESGSGKSASALAVMGLHDRRRTEVVGSIDVAGVEVVGAPDARLSGLRGRSVGMVFQNPQSALHPMKTVGDQVDEAYRTHHPRASRREARARTVAMLERVGIPAAARRAGDYPHQFSGGMRQRAMIAMALINEPAFLIADEPTTALDVTVQAQILDLIDELKAERGLGVVLITHDFGVVSEIADDVLVMYAGRCVERGPVRDVLDRPRMPYTAALLASLPALHDTRDQLIAIPGTPADLGTLRPGCDFAPRCSFTHLVGDDRCRTELPALRVLAPGRSARCHLDAVPSLTVVEPSARIAPARPVTAGEPLLRVTDLVKHFPVRGRGLRRHAAEPVRAVDGVSLTLYPGESLGLVGESGCGKSTTGRLIVRLLEPTSGSIEFGGRELVGVGERALRPDRRDFQMIFQNPVSSLNGRHTAASIIGTPLRVHEIVPRDRIRDRVRELMALVGLNPDHADRYPHEFSGGQRQRIGIARALAVEPKLIVADEPVSSLDVSVQAQVVNLLAKLQAELGIAFLFIAHDLAVVRQFCQQVAVMYLGRIVEQGPREAVYSAPAHPYTRALLAAVPDPRRPRSGPRAPLRGEVEVPSGAVGCPFRNRCPLAQDICHSVDPVLRTTADGHQVACHFADVAVPTG